MLDRVLNAYLGGLIDEDAAMAKQSALKAELADVEAQLAHEPVWDPRAYEKALAVFNLSQKAGEIWQRSTSAEKRALLDALCLNRTVGAVSLVLEERSPFNLLAEGRSLNNGRPHCSQVGTDPEHIQEFIKPFIDSGLGGLHLAVDLARRVA